MKETISESMHLSEAMDGFLARADDGRFAPVALAVDGLDEELAARVPAPRFNSMWAVVNHPAFWQEVVILRLRGLEADQRTRHTPVNDGWREDLAK